MMDVPTRQPAALVLAEVVQAKAARAVTRRCGTHKRQRVRLLACQSRHAHTESRAPPLNCCNLLSKCNVLLSKETDNAPLVLHGCAQHCHVRIREGSFEHSPPMQMWTRTVRKRAEKSCVRRAFLVRIRPCFVLAFCMSRSVFGPAHPERCLTAVTHNEAICHHCRRRTRAGANRRRFSARRRSARAPACSLSLAMYATSSPYVRFNNAQGA